MATRAVAGYYLMYLRKSRADAEKERIGRYETLALHQRQLTELAERRGLRVERVYRELVSGETIEERAEFRRVMDRIQDPDCLGVIVHAIDRLGRGDPMEYGWVLSSLRYTGTLVVTPDKTYDPCDRSDFQSLKMQMFIANAELDRIRDRLACGLQDSARRGNYLGSKPPYGYDKVVGRSAIVPNEAEAPVVRLIFDMAASGSNKGAIARRLNSDGIPTRHGSTWSASRVGTILSNPVYKGMVRYGYRRERVVSRDGLRFVRKTTVSEPGDYILAEGVHEPLVSDEVWEAAQGAFEGVPVKRDRTLKNPLAGLVVCGRCGRALVRQVVRNRYGSTYERLRHAYNTRCGCRSADLGAVTSALCEALARAADDLEVRARSGGGGEGELEAVERAIAEEDRRLDKLLELYYADAITVDEFKARRSSSEARLLGLRERRDELASRSVDPMEVVSTTREALRMLADGSVPAEEVNACLRSFVERVDYFRDDEPGGRIRLVVRLRGLP